LAPAMVLLVEVVAAAVPHRRSDAIAEAREAPSFAVLVPAHDEAAGIAASLATILPQLRAGDRILVVADNCTDTTADVARNAGVEVVERRDALQRGKGHALDFGLRALAARRPAVVIVVDADCACEPGSLRRLATRALQSGRPVQALYRMHAPHGAGLRTRIAAFAWIVKNQVRPLGLQRLGLPCQLMGTGMAFPWPLIAGAPLASSHLVEDLQLGLDLAAAGTPPLFCPEACVHSEFPLDAEALVAQRTRWEHGHLSVLAAVGGPLLWRAIARGRPALAALALDLCVPPLASLVLLASAATVLGAVLAALGGSAAPLALAATSLVAIGSAVMLAWNGHGRSVVSLGELLRAPVYALAKIPIYARLLRKRQVEWVRTRRGDGSG
jgi:cellulose synthase/poly-beta-1,6-N-acetylglucosamine synthase-like glycosyltransferase